MKYSLLILEEVSDELNEASLYYEKLQPGLGVKFLDHWDIALNDISKGPLSFQKVKKQYRLIHINRFPYSIVYEVFDSSVVIYRLIHTKKRPRKRYQTLQQKTKLKKSR